MEYAVMTTTTETQRALDKIISTIGDLPTTPAIIATLMNLTADIDTDINKITRAIMADQSLTAKVLKLSNSSFYGRAKEVRTLNEAIIILGFMTLHSLIIATSTQTLYQKAGDDGVSGKLWEHAFAVALASRLVAQAVHFPFVEEAFIGGLLHDIGKLVLMQKTPEEYRRIIAEVEKTRGSFSGVRFQSYSRRLASAPEMVVPAGIDRRRRAASLSHRKRQRQPAFAVHHQYRQLHGQEPRSRIQRL